MSNLTNIMTRGQMIMTKWKEVIKITKKQKDLISEK